MFSDVSGIQMSGIWIPTVEVVQQITFFPGFPWSNYIKITFIMLIILLQISKLTVKNFKDVCGVLTSTRVGRYANP